jgi:hypothetical protein
MLVQGMNYLLDIKQDLLLTPNGETIASNQQSAISTKFPLIFILPHYILLCFLPLLRALLHLFVLLKSYGARLCLHSLVIPIDCC